MANKRSVRRTRGGAAAHPNMVQHIPVAPPLPPQPPGFFNALFGPANPPIPGAIPVVAPPNAPVPVVAPPNIPGNRNYRNFFQTNAMQQNYDIIRNGRRFINQVFGDWRIEIQHIEDEDIPSYTIVIAAPNNDEGIFTVKLQGNGIQLTSNQADEDMIHGMETVIRHIIREMEDAVAVAVINENVNMMGGRRGRRHRKTRHRRKHSKKTHKRRH